MSKVNENGFVNQLVEKYGYLREDAEAIVKDFCGLISDNVAQGNSVSLPGFGRFGSKKCGEESKPYFTPGRSLKEGTAGLMRENTARELRFQKLILHQIMTGRPEDALDLLNNTAPAPSGRFFTKEDLSGYYGVTTDYVMGVLSRFRINRNSAPDDVWAIHTRNGYIPKRGGSPNYYSARVALGLSVMMCFGRKSILNSRAMAVYQTLKASAYGDAVRKDAARVERRETAGAVKTENVVSLSPAVLRRLFESAMQEAVQTAAAGE